MHGIKWDSSPDGNNENPSRVVYMRARRIVRDPCIACISLHPRSSPRREHAQAFCGHNVSVCVCFQSLHTNAGEERALFLLSPGESPCLLLRKLSRQWKEESVLTEPRGWGTSSSLRSPNSGHGEGAHSAAIGPRTARWMARRIISHTGPGRGPGDNLARTKSEN